MWHPRRVPLLALTGGIASGKSTIAALLADRGAVVVDADAIVREVQAPGSAVLEEIAGEFGAGVLRPDGSAIPGLYAAGNTSAAVMGHTYAGPGATIGPAMTFGYLAVLDLAAPDR